MTYITAWADSSASVIAADSAITDDDGKVTGTCAKIALLFGRFLVGTSGRSSVFEAIIRLESAVAANPGTATVPCSAEELVAQIREVHRRLREHRPELVSTLCEILVVDTQGEFPRVSRWQGGFNEGGHLKSFQLVDEVPVSCWADIPRKRGSRLGRTPRGKMLSAPEFTRGQGHCDGNRLTTVAALRIEHAIEQEPDAVGGTISWIVVDARGCRAHGLATCNVPQAEA
jgi:hypothetical protein